MIIKKTKELYSKFIYLNYKKRAMNVLKKISIIEKSDNYKKVFLSSRNTEEKIACIYLSIKRHLGIKLYMEQITAALLMYDGYSIDMKTGEGKSLVIIPVAIMKAKEGKVHIVTVNEYLSTRDALKYKVIYNDFNLKCAANISEENNENVDKTSIHSSNIIYSSATEIVFDYLRTRDYKENLINADDLKTVIIDEIDFVLIDNAVSSCSVSTGAEKKNIEDEHYLKMVDLAHEVISKLKGYKIPKNNKDLEIYDYYNCDYVYKNFDKMVSITEKGYKKINKILGYNVVEDIKLYASILYAIEAKTLYKKGVDYLVEKDKMGIINKKNGRFMRNSTFAGRLTNAIERKENITLTNRDTVSNSISYQVFFDKYKDLIGLSGTAYGIRDELSQIFNIETVKVPEHKKSRRIDEDDIICKTKSEKYKKACEVIKKNRNKNIPTIVVTFSDRESINFKKILEKENISNIILNNYNIEKENEIVKKMGDKIGTYISTSLIGRGTDIVLNESIKNKEGIHVIVLNRYESKRVDNQVRGRAGRQGQKGRSSFIISLEDRVFDFMDNKKLNKYKNMKKSKFESKRIQYKLSKYIKYLQGIILEKEKSTREVNFYIDREVEKMRNQVFNEKVNFVKQEKDNKYSKITNRIASEVIKKLWSNLHKELNYLKQDVQIVEPRQELQFPKFKKMAYKKLNDFEKIAIKIALKKLNKKAGEEIENV